MEGESINAGTTLVASVSEPRSPPSMPIDAKANDAADRFDAISPQSPTVPPAPSEGVKDAAADGEGDSSNEVTEGTDGVAPVSSAPEPPASSLPLLVPLPSSPSPSPSLSLDSSPPSPTASITHSFTPCQRQRQRQTLSASAVEEDAGVEIKAEANDDDDTGSQNLESSREFKSEFESRELDHDIMKERDETRDESEGAGENSVSPVNLNSNVDSDLALSDAGHENKVETSGSSAPVPTLTSNEPSIAPSSTSTDDVSSSLIPSGNSIPELANISHEKASELDEESGERRHIAGGEGNVVGEVGVVESIASQEIEVEVEAREKPSSLATDEPNANPDPNANVDVAGPLTRPGVVEALLPQDLPSSSSDIHANPDTSLSRRPSAASHRSSDSYSLAWFFVPPSTSTQSSPLLRKQSLTSNSSVVGSPLRSTTPLPVTGTGTGTGSSTSSVVGGSGSRPLPVRSRTGFAGRLIGPRERNPSGGSRVPSRKPSLANLQQQAVSTSPSANTSGTTFVGTNSAATVISTTAPSTVSPPVSASALSTGFTSPPATANSTTPVFSPRAAPPPAETNSNSRTSSPIVHPTTLASPPLTPAAASIAAVCPTPSPPVSASHPHFLPAFTAYSSQSPHSSATSSARTSTATSYSYTSSSSYSYSSGGRIRSRPVSEFGSDLGHGRSGSVDESGQELEILPTYSQSFEHVQLQLQSDPPPPPLPPLPTLPNQPAPIHSHQHPHPLPMPMHPQPSIHALPHQPLGVHTHTVVEAAPQSLSQPTALPAVQTVTVTSILSSTTPPLALGPVPSRRPSRGVGVGRSAVAGLGLEAVREEGNGSSPSSLSANADQDQSAVASAGTSTNVNASTGEESDHENENAMVGTSRAEQLRRSLMLDGGIVTTTSEPTASTSRSASGRFLGAPLSPPLDTRITRSNTSSPVPPSPRTAFHPEHVLSPHSPSHSAPSRRSSTHSPLPSAPSTPLPAVSSASFQPLPPPVPIQVSLTPPTLPASLRPLTLAAAHWSLSSAQLQSIVSRAIRASAEPSAVRLLPLEVLDGELNEMVRKVEEERRSVSARIRWEVGRRAMLVQGLNALAWTGIGGNANPGGGPVGAATSPLTQLTHSLHTSTTTLDDLYLQLHSLDLQLHSLKELQSTHHSSALAVALRKLHSSLAKRAKDVDGLKRRVAELEAERDEAWRVAEEMAKEVDEHVEGEKERRRKSGDLGESDGEGEGEVDWEDVSVEDDASVVEMVNITGRAVAAPALLTRASRIGDLEGGVEVPTIQLYVPQMQSPSSTKQRPKSFLGESSTSKVASVKTAREEAVKAAKRKSAGSEESEEADEGVRRAAEVPLPMMTEEELKELELGPAAQDVKGSVSQSSSLPLPQSQSRSLPIPVTQSTDSRPSPPSSRTQNSVPFSVTEVSGNMASSSTQSTAAPPPPPKERPYSHNRDPSLPAPPPPYSSPISTSPPSNVALPTVRQRSNSTTSARSVRSVRSTRSTKSATSRVTAARTRSMRASKASLRIPSGNNSASGSKQSSPLDAPILAGVAAGLAGESNFGGMGSGVPEVPKLPRFHPNAGPSAWRVGDGDARRSLGLVIPQTPMRIANPNLDQPHASSSQPPQLPPIPSVQLPNDGIDSFLEMLTRPNSAVESEEGSQGLEIKGGQQREKEKEKEATRVSAEEGSNGETDEGQIVTMPITDRMLPFSASFAEELSRRLPLPPPSPGAPRSPIRPFSAKLAPPVQALPQGVDGTDDDVGIDAFMDPHGRWKSRTVYGYGAASTSVPGGPLGAYALHSSAQAQAHAQASALENIDEDDAFSALNDFADAYTRGYITASPKSGSGSGSRSKTNSMLPLPRKNSANSVDKAPSPTNSRNSVSALPYLRSAPSPQSNSSGAINSPVSPAQSAAQSFQSQHRNTASATSADSNQSLSPISSRGEGPSAAPPQATPTNNVAPRKRMKRSFKFGALRRPSSMPLGADNANDNNNDTGKVWGIF